jgi:hypothetical protein
MSGVGQLVPFLTRVLPERLAVDAAPEANVS